MEEILHQLRLAVYPIIYEVLGPSQVVGLGISSINRTLDLWLYTHQKKPRKIGTTQHLRDGRTHQNCRCAGAEGELLMWGVGFSNAGFSTILLNAWTLFFFSDGNHFPR